MSLSLAWGARVPEWFRNKVIAISDEIGIDPSWLMAIMKFESNFDPQARNPNSSASGLIQFMESTAVGLGTTIDAIRSMTSMEQLEYVRKYFLPYKGRLKTLSDAYCCVLYPMAIGLPDEAVIFPAGSQALLVNKGLDLNHDQAVTKAEAASLVATALFHGYQFGNVIDLAETQPAAPIEERSTTLPPATQPEQPMGALALPFLTTLLPQILGMFTGKTQATVAATTAATPDITSTLLNTLMTLIGQKVGIPVVNEVTATQAVAAVTSMPDPVAKAALVTDLETHVLDYLDKIGPMVDKLAQMDKDRWAADIAGRDAASQRGLRDRWDMTPFLVVFAGTTSTLLVLSLLGAIIYQATTGERDIDTALVGLGGPLLAIAMGVWREIFSYRFDGSTTSNAARFVDKQVEVSAK